MEFIELKKSDERRGDDFVRRSNYSTYHQIGWKNVVGKTYGYMPIYLVTMEDELKKVPPLRK